MPERLSNHSEWMTQELPPEVAAQPPLQESSHIKEATTPVPQSCAEGDPHSKEPQKPVEESQQQAPSVPVVPLMAINGNSHVPASCGRVQVSTTHKCIVVSLYLVVFCDLLIPTLSLQECYH